MNTSTSNRLTTPIRTRWLIQLLCLLLSIIALIIFVFPDTTMEPGWRKNPAVFIPFLVVAAVTLGFHHTIMDKGIIVRLFGLPVRLVPWSEVTHAVYFRTVNGGNHMTIEGSGIFVSLSDCPPFLSGSDDHILVRLKHPISSMFIRLPYHASDAEPFVTLFKHYYSSLIIQPRNGP